MSIAEWNASGARLDPKTSGSAGWAEFGGAGATRSRAQADGPVEEAAREARHPLGPLLAVRRLQRPVVGRLWAAGVAVGCGAILGLAARLQPSATGYGTHTQLGMPPCSFLIQTGYPCPTCGVTTSVAEFARGRWLASLVDHPAGFVLALGTAVAGILASGTLISGYSVRVNWYRVSPTRVVWGFVVLWVVGWIWKVIVGMIGGSLPVR